MLEHDGLVLEPDFNQRRVQSRRLAVDLNGNAGACGQPDVLGLANAFACSAQLKLGQGGREASDHFEAAIVHGLGEEILICGRSPRVRATAVPLKPGFPALT